LKSLLNVLGVSFLAAGTADTVRALATDPQFITRFEKLELHKWELNKTTRNLISTIETHLPLPEKSGLATDPELLSLIVKEGQESIGGIMALIRNAAIIALESGKAKITKEHIAAAASDLSARKIKPN
jgi:hypothetical protein